MNDINRAENRTAQEFNANIARTNAQLEESYIDRKARDEGAYNTAKAANRAKLFENIGNIGRDLSNKQLVKRMFGYTWNGEYWIDNKGNKVSNEDINKAFETINNKDKKE